MRTARFLLIVSIGMCFALGAFAQDYPTKPVTVIVPFTAGSATDIIARTVGQKLSELWGQPVAFENHPGAGGAAGAGVAAKSTSGGYTLLVSAAFATCPALYNKLPYDPSKDFVDIAPLARQPMALIVGSSGGAKSVSGLIEAAKAKPGKLKYGSPGIGSVAHLAAEKFRGQAGIDVAHSPYKGGPETIAATSNGSVAYSFLPIAAAMKGVRAGKLRALAVTSAKRSSLMPDVPTIAEAGLAGYEETLWWGIWTPAGTPASVADKLAGDIARALKAPDVLEKLAKGGFEPMSMSRDEFARFVRGEMKAVALTVKEAGIKPR
jgi:tripartite-type tricarboxylate transporter receptor subunit TctC